MCITRVLRHSQRKSGEIDVVEGIALAIKKGQTPPVSHLWSTKWNLLHQPLKKFCKKLGKNLRRIFVLFWKFVVYSKSDNREKSCSKFYGCRGEASSFKFKTDSVTKEILTLESMPFSKKKLFHSHYTNILVQTKSRIESRSFGKLALHYMDLLKKVGAKAVSQPPPI